MQYLLYILSIPFIYLNYKILISDIKNKIIPNKYLIYLLYIIPIYYIYIFFTFPDINYLVLLSQVIITFVISFILYYFGIWAAGDAKYLLVLSLFIPNLGIIPLLGNISLLIIVYLLFYFIWFYLGKLTFNAEYRKSLILNVKQDLKEKWFNYKEKKGGKTFIIILKWLIVFLLIFVSIRLSRTYLFNTFFENGNNFIIVQDIINKRNIYLLFLIIGILFLFIYLIRNLISKIKEYINKKTSINLNILSNLFIFILSLSLLGFILKEYLIEPEKISKLLFLIFTLYLALRIFFKILFYSYKITFGIAELTYIDIGKLKEGDLIDKPYLIKIFGKQITLGAEGENQNKKGILYPDPIEKLNDLSNSVTSDDIKIIKKCFIETNKYHSLQSDKFIENNTIKILKTFSFAPYLYIGFIMTYIYDNQLINYILNSFIEIIKRLAGS